MEIERVVVQVAVQHIRRLITAHDSHTAWLNVSLVKTVIPGCVHTEVLRSAGGQCVCITLPLLVIVDH